MLLSGYDADVVETLIASPLSPGSLGALGAQSNPTIGRHQLAFTMTPQDVVLV